MSRCGYVFEHVEETSINETGPLSSGLVGGTRADLFHAGECCRAFLVFMKAPAGGVFHRSFCVRALVLGQARSTSCVG